MQEPNKNSTKPLAPDVADVFNAYPTKHRKNLMTVRQLIFDVADSIEGVGPIEETLKWGEPAYLTSKSKSGTTIRIDWKPKNPDNYAMYVSCQTSLVERYRQCFPKTFTFDGNRGILFNTGAPIPIEPLSKCIAAALTYHREKRHRR